MEDFRRLTSGFLKYWLCSLVQKGSYNKEASANKQLSLCLLSVYDIKWLQFLFWPDIITFNLRPHTYTDDCTGLLLEKALTFLLCALISLRSVRRVLVRLIKQAIGHWDEQETLSIPILDHTSVDQVLCHILTNRLTERETGGLKADRLVSCCVVNV